MSDHGLWSQPVLCSLSQYSVQGGRCATNRWENKVTLDFGLDLRDCTGQTVVCRREGVL